MMTRPCRDGASIADEVLGLISIVWHTGVVLQSLPGIPFGSEDVQV